MANRTASDDAETLPVVADGPRPLAPETIEAYESMIASVPEAGGEGMEAILAIIAQAGDTADLDAPWRAAGLKEYLNVPLVITGIKRMPSEYDGGLPWFLVIEGAVRATGEKLTVTNGSAGVVAQLVKAWQLGAFPLTVVPRESKRPTSKGYYPQHLEIVRS